MSRNYTKQVVRRPVLPSILRHRLPFENALLSRRRTARALANRLVSLNEATGPKLDVLVVSPGGSGSTQLIDHISKFYKCNSREDSDGLKHLPVPPPATIAAKVIFVYRDPAEIRGSLDSRGISKMQVKKLRPQGMKFGHPARSNLEVLIQLQHEAFKSWDGAPVLFIHYRELFESAKVISDFLGHKDGFVETFPERKTRDAK